MTTVVLLDSAGDVAVVRALLRSHEIDPGPLELVDLQGITNIGRHLADLRQLRADDDVLGLCDAAQSAPVVKALAADGLPVADATDLPVYGFFVCEPTLEDELVAALGGQRAHDALVAAGLGNKLEALTVQPAWVDRTREEQVRGFLGVASGKQAHATAVLAAALAADELPESLSMLVERLRWAA